MPQKLPQDERTPEALDAGAIDAIEGNGRDRVLVDREARGLVVRVRKTGTKHFAFQFSHSGRLFRIPLGVATGAGLGAARHRARELRRRADAARELGQDPVAALRAVAAGSRKPRLGDVARKGPTLAEVFRDYCDHRTQNRKWADRTVDKHESDFRLHIGPRLGSVPIEGIGIADVDRVRRALADSPGAAGSALRLIRAVCNFAERRRLRPRGSNPVDGEDIYRSPKRQVHLSAEEFQRYGAALAAEEESGRVSPWATLGLRLLALTGARKMEICGCRWEWFDQAAGVLRLPESKTGPRSIILPAAARALLAAAPRVASSPYLIFGHRPGGRANFLDRLHYRARAAAGLSRIRIHDLRHAWATTASELGIAYPLVAAALGHTLRGTTGGYVHVSVSALRGPVDVVGAWIDDAMNGREARVLAFPTAQA